MAAQDLANRLQMGRDAYTFKGSGECNKCGQPDESVWCLAADCEPAVPSQLRESSYAPLALTREIAASRQWEASGKDPNWSRQYPVTTPVPIACNCSARPYPHIGHPDGSGEGDKYVRRWRDESEILCGRDVMTPKGMGMLLGVSASGLIQTAIPPDFYSIQEFPQTRYGWWKLVPGRKCSRKKFRA